MEIEKNVPLPINKRGAKEKNIKIIELMEVGDSIFFEYERSWNVYNRFYNVAKRQGKHIVVRAVDGGTRMWRDK